MIKKKKIKKIKLHDHTCPENWRNLEEKVNELIEALNKDNA